MDSFHGAHFPSIIRENARLQCYNVVYRTNYIPVMEGDYARNRSNQSDKYAGCRPAIVTHHGK